ncbi:MAG: hypothetical protein APF76_00435 [Desulfitibacter sp. BRH_c19]|nr:MAG: hypothetical protein APF76_00435 [Desulfitibacter sp. BRH_c19]
MAGIVKVVGTGPGDENYITPIGLETIKLAEILVGGQRLLDTFANDGQEQFPVDKDLKKAIEYINEKRYSKNIVVLVSGDTGIYSLANYLTKHIDPDDLEFIPGISSIQLMFARIKKPWNEAQILSMHGRTLDIVVEVVKQSKMTALLTGSPWTPQKIADYLISEGVLDMKVIVGKDLSYPWEILIDTTLQELAKVEEDYSNSVMVILNE